MRDNRFVHDSVGISLDSLYRAGHPGVPPEQHDHPRQRDRPQQLRHVRRGRLGQVLGQAAVGTGAWIVGGNDNIVKNNHIYDNWRWGVTLITVPDALSNNFDRPPQFPEDATLSTSHRNTFTANTMGRSPGGERLPNGTDFWWDELGQGNCWEGNSGPGAVTSDPPPACRRATSSPTRAPAIRPRRPTWPAARSR